MNQNAKSIVIQVKKSTVTAQNYFDYQNLMDKRAHLIPCTITEKDEDLIFTFAMDGVKNLSELKKETLEDQYQLLINIHMLYPLFMEFRFPFTDENIYYDENMIPYIAFRDIGRNKVKDVEKDFLYEYQCLTAGILSKKYSWSQVIESGLEIVEKDKSLSAIRESKTIQELTEILRNKKQEYCQMIRETKIRVDKNKYRRNKVIARVLLTLFAACLFYTGYQTIFVVPLQKTVINATDSYIIQDYVGCIDELNNIKLSQMDKYTKYILAASYTKAENFNQVEMKNIASKLTISSNEKEFEYWICLGRLELAQAQNIAKALSDDKLLVYAYLKEINTLENNTAMDGAEKQSRLDELNQAMNTLGQQYLDEGSN